MENNYGLQLFGELNNLCRKVRRLRAWYLFLPLMAFWIGLLAEGSIGVFASFSCAVAGFGAGLKVCKLNNEIGCKCNELKESLNNQKLESNIHVNTSQRQQERSSFKNSNSFSFNNSQDVSFRRSVATMREDSSMGYTRKRKNKDKRL